MRTLHRLGTVGLAAGLAAGALGLTAPVASAAGDCGTDCLPNLLVRVAPDRATFTTHPTASAHVEVQLRAAGGQWKTWSAPGTYYTSDSVTIDTSTQLTLSQQTTYQYAVSATDTEGRTWEEKGSFTTGRRDVDVRWSALTVTDDSDVSGAAALAGAARIPLSPCATLAPMAPLTPTSSVAATSPTALALDTSAVYGCDGVPTSVSVRTLVADDDSNGGAGDCWGTWPPAVFNPSGFVTSGDTGCYEWTSGSTSVNAPGAWDGTGTLGAVPLTVAGSGSGGSQLSYLAQGTATFSATSPTVTPGSGSARALAVTAKAYPEAIAVSWSRPADAVVATATATYQVAVRPFGSGTWSTTSVPASTSSTTITGLTDGTTYEVRVRVMDAASRPLLATTTTALPKATSVVTSTSTPVTARPGTKVSTPVTVTSVGAPRQLIVQKRAPGSAAWVAHTTVATAADGTATVTYPVLPGVWSWRVVVMEYASHLAAAGPVRVVTSRTAIAGFITKAAVVRKGTLLKDAVVVTPGAGRAVKVQFRKAGTATWKTFATKKASSKGAATVVLKAFPGRFQWRLLTAATPTHGTAAATAVRVVTGR